MRNAWIVFAYFGKSLICIFKIHVTHISLKVGRPIMPRI